MSAQSLYFRAKTARIVVPTSQQLSSDDKTLKMADSYSNETKTKTLPTSGDSRFTRIANGTRIILKILSIFLPHLFGIIRLKYTAFRHNSTYKAVESPKNIVIVGGSFAGAKLARWLADSVPTGYRVVLVEKNSHFNYWFAFPRYSVVRGWEKGAFVPYDQILGNTHEKGSMLHIQAEALRSTDKQVLLANGEAVDYAYLIIATGSWQPSPAKMTSTSREGACDEFKGVQNGIEGAERIAVLGSGGVGVELASDIKTYYPKKSVTLFSSRDAVMPNFGAKLQTYVGKRLDALGVDMRYNSRPQALSDRKTIQLPDGTTEEYDLVVS